MSRRSYEVRSYAENTGLDGHRFVCRGDAEVAAGVVNDMFSDACAEVVEVGGMPTITLEQWEQEPWR